MENLSLGNNITKRKEGSVEETLKGGREKMADACKSFQSPNKLADIARCTGSLRPFNRATITL